MEISQIKGSSALVQGDFYPRAPRAGRLKEVANTTTIVVEKVKKISDVDATLYYKNPETDELEVCDPINSANYEFTLNARDATNPFKVLVTYDYVNHQVVVRQSDPAADPVLPEIGENEYFIANFIEQPIGTEQTSVEPAPATNFFKWRAITKAAGTHSDIIDFQYAQTYLTLTGAITIPNTITNLTGDSLPDGKSILLIVRGSSYAITWGSNFVATDNSLPMSTSSTKWNRILIMKNMVSGKFEYTNTETITA